MVLKKCHVKIKILQYTCTVEGRLKHQPKLNDRRSKYDNKKASSQRPPCTLLRDMFRQTRQNSARQKCAQYDQCMQSQTQTIKQHMNIQDKTNLVFTTLEGSAAVQFLYMYRDLNEYPLAGWSEALCFDAASYNIQALLI